MNYLLPKKVRLFQQLVPAQVTLGGSLRSVTRADLRSLDGPWAHLPSPQAPPAAWLSWGHLVRSAPTTCPTSWAVPSVVPEVFPKGGASSSPRGCVRLLSSASCAQHQGGRGAHSVLSLGSELIPLAALLRNCLLPSASTHGACPYECGGTGELP